MILTTVMSLAVLGQVVLPGSNLSLQQAKDEARIVVVAEVVKTGSGLGIGAVSILTGIKLDPSIVLKGKAEGEELENLSVSASGNERLPMAKEEFIFFIIKNKESFNILKLLPKTEENLASIKTGDG